MTTGKIPKAASSTTLTDSLVAETAAGGGVAGLETVTGALATTQGTLTAAQPNLSGTVTWNSGGTTFTGWKLNVTNTASATGSLLQDLQLGGTTLFGVRSDGPFTIHDYVTSGLYYGGSYGGTTEVNFVLSDYNPRTLEASIGGNPGGGNLVLLGGNVTMSTQFSTILGVAAGGSITTASDLTLIGETAGGSLTTGGTNICIGEGACLGLTTGARNTHIGNFSGPGAPNPAINDTLAIGNTMIPTATGQALIGSTNNGLTDIYWGKGVTSASASATVTMQATGASGSDVAGKDFILAGPKATGNAVPGNLYFATSTAGSTGTTLQTLTNRWLVSGATPGSGHPGDFLAATDGAVNIGASGANRPDKIFVKTSINVNGVDITPIPSTPCLVVGADNGAVLVDSDLGPQTNQYQYQAASTINEINITADAGTPNVQVRKRHCAGFTTGTCSSFTTTNLLSGVLAAPALATAVACAKSAISQTCVDGTTSSGTVTVSTTAVAAGDFIELTSGTAGGSAHRVTVCFVSTTP